MVRAIPRSSAGAVQSSVTARVLLDSVTQVSAWPPHSFRRVWFQALPTFLRASGLSRPQIDEVEAASQARRRELEADLRPFPGVRLTLEQLCRSGFALGVLSDSEQPAAQLERRLRRMGLGGVFRTIVSSVEIQHIKPQAICYRSVLDRLGLPASRSIFVGHDAAELAGVPEMAETPL